jgi:hypothetical protein
MVRPPTFVRRVESMIRALHASLVVAGLLLVSPPTQADCADAFGCVCRAQDVVVVATVVDVRQDGYIDVEIDRVEEIEPGAAEGFVVGDVVQALPDMQVRQGARAYLTATGPGETDLVQFNQAEADGSVECSGAVFDEEELIATATAPNCTDLAEAKGIRADCVDEYHGCATRRPSPSGGSLVPIAGLLALVPLLRRRFRRSA